MNQYVEKGAKRQRLCENAETMTDANRACEVFMRWYLDERIHQVISDCYQMVEVVIADWELESSLHEMAPEDFKEIASESNTNYFDPESDNGWSDFALQQLLDASDHIRVFNSLLIDKKELPVPLGRRKAEMGDDNFPKRPPLDDSLDVVFRLFKDLENFDFKASMYDEPKK